MSSMRSASSSTRISIRRASRRRSEVVEQSARRGDDDIDAGAERVLLRPIPTPPKIAAAVIGVWTAIVSSAVDLRRQLARRGDHQRARFAARPADQPMKDRQQERRRLAAARHRAGKNVPPLDGGGIASACMGVGRVKPSSFSPLWNS